ncbi:O-antigen ligase family protein [Dyadobacter sp. CY107]|uniref:O-antigen ligase family protein n=1 Tax=Dyadobacter fanqingshengii TaxID=2906443 RepID=UPI001F1C5EB2|nr:O-antigen ligase family protein [Dyadobacter fanqingshengii]MCF2504704.1 O-antigen ligase family protein [Dyadobacter fanqingshengii]
MVKVVILIFILAIGIFRWLSTAGRGKAATYMVISLFVQTLPFGFGKAVHVFIEGKMTEDDRFVRLGEFSNVLRLEMPLVFILFLIFFGFGKLKAGAFGIKQNVWIYILFFFSLITAINPYNPEPLAFSALIFPLVQFLILFKLIEANFTPSDILKGIYDGMLMVVLLQFSLAICYPVLGFESMAAIFRGEQAYEWSQRRGMTSAIGTFGHPGHLALYCLVLLLFFLGCYLNNYHKKKSLYLVLMAGITLVLTFSRTAIFCAIIIIPIVFLVHKRGARLLSVKNIVYFALLSGVFIILLYLSPIGYLFFESDSTIQFNNRYIHWALGYQIWEKSPFFGVGINTHVYYMLNQLKLNIDIPAVSFYTRSPIHNIHMIVLAETGLIGFAFWLVFFFGRIKMYYVQCQTNNTTANIFNLTYVGILFSVFLYGFIGWSPFILEIYSLCFLLGYFAKNQSRKSINVHVRRRQFEHSN